MADSASLSHRSGRLDSEDSERTHFDVREAYWQGVFGDWEIVAGADRVFWGVTESRHLVDIVNQYDFVEDIDEEDKLGQPMLRLEWQRSWGRLSGMALVGFRERTFPGPNGRLRFPLPVDRDASLFPDGKRAVDLAFRYGHFFGDFDLGLGVFHGTSREPSFPGQRRRKSAPPFLLPDHPGGPRPASTPATPWLWKLEALVREGQGRTFGAAVAGFEYTRYQIFGSAADLGILAEYLYDDRDEAAPATTFARGLFIGTRLALNDVDDTSVLAGAVVDLENGSISGRVEAERRITDFLRLELESRNLREHRRRQSPLRAEARQLRHAEARFLVLTAQDGLVPPEAAPDASVRPRRVLAHLTPKLPWRRGRSVFRVP